MREIIFKAKTCNGEWVEGLLANKDTKWYISNRAGQPFAFEVRPDTICQYTGLTDKNGRKIWENDIVHVSYIDGMDECNELVNVTYTKHGFSPWSWEYSCDGCDLYCELLSVEVIGNVFDNPKLLEKAR